VYTNVYWTLKKVVMNVEKNKKYAANEIQIERQAEKKAHTHDTASQKQANREEMCVSETEAIIGKAPRLGILTLKFKRDIQHVMPPVCVITSSESKYSMDPKFNQ